MAGIVMFITPLRCLFINWEGKKKWPMKDKTNVYIIDNAYAIHM